MKTTTHRTSSIVMLALFLCFIFGFSAAFFIIPDRDRSENENRVLASAPKFSWEGLRTGDFTADVKEWFADQFPLRDFFVSLKGSAELLLGKRENNGIIYADNGYLIDRLAIDKDAISGNLENLGKLNSAVETPITVAIAPRKIDALSYILPSSLSTTGDDTFAFINEVIDDNALSVCDLYTPLKNGEGEYLYYKTDHHLTEHGAYKVYLTLAEEWGVEPYGEDHFTVSAVTDEFYGTTWSASSTLGVTPDKIELYRYDGDENYTVTTTGGDSFEGFYDEKYLAEKDKYALFLSGINARVSVKKNDSGDREKILILNDSFANALVPFLALHYDIDLIDPRFLRSGVIDEISSGEYCRVLLYMNVDTLSTSPKLLAPLTVGID